MFKFIQRILCLFGLHGRCINLDDSYKRFRCTSCGKVFKYNKYLD